MGFPINVYPSGVISNANRTVTFTTVGDFFGGIKLVYKQPLDEINAMFKQSISNPSVLLNFDFKMRLIELCLTMLGDVRMWLTKQVTSNPFIYGTNKGFVIDTFRFIVTGKREVMLPIWESLVEPYPEINSEQTELSSSRELEELSKLINEDFNFLTEWVNRKNGLLDMLVTMKILFGGDAVYTAKVV